jgi:hypothetical protein
LLNSGGDELIKSNYPQHSIINPHGDNMSVLAPSPLNNLASIRPQFFESKAGLDQLLIENKTLKSGINQQKQQ